MTTLFSRLTPLLFVVLLPVSQHAQAIVIEPFVGYASGTYEYGGYTTATYSDVAKDFKGTGMAYGGRLGIEYFFISIGGQYSSGNFTLKGKDYLELDKDYTYTTSQMGAFLGLQLSSIFRIWGTYFFSADDKVKDVTFDADGAANPIAAVTATEKLKGKGMEFGFGYTGLPIVSINLSMSTMNYNDIKHPFVTGDTTKIADVTVTMYMLSLSAPISF
jgi:hypothetical protein